jgi:hypothetical protein
MDHPPAHRRAVFLSERCKRVFGQLQFTTDTKRKVIKQAVRDRDISVAGFSEQKLIGILRYLIGKGVFHAEVAAQLEFPDLYGPSLASTYQQMAMENMSADHQLPNTRSPYAWMERCDHLATSKSLVVSY